MKRLISLLAALALCWTAFAQQNLMGTAVELKSPDIHEDYSVTFRVYAPKAMSVRLTGDFLPHHVADNNRGSDLGGHGRGRRRYLGIYHRTAAR